MKLSPFSPEDFLELSKELIDTKEELKSNNSAINRTIIDRLYYALFLYLRSWIETNIKEYKINYNVKDHSIIRN
ncbi:MAG: hypothetical protein LBM96_00570 [Methanobrevibacter sp.]|jgi:hypothetical protein|nr:hypothetical protein [Candidatus Methanoflexus mossambicus]